MNERNAGSWMVVRLAILLLVGLQVAGCTYGAARVGALQNESQSVEVGDAKSVNAQINLGAGDLRVKGGAEKLLEADFTYNVARIKPVVEYKNGTLVVRQPDANGLPALQGISGFRNEWDLRFNDQVPMDLKVNVGGGVSDLQLGGLSLTGLDVSLGAGRYTIDLTGDWVRDLDVKIGAGATDLTVRLPKDVGARVKVESGPHTISTAGLTKNGDVYTNAAYGKSDVTLQVDLNAGVGQIKLETAG